MQNQHTHTYGSSNYDSMGDLGSKIVSTNPPNVGNEQEKQKNPLQESQSENYNSTAQAVKSLKLSLLQTKRIVLRFIILSRLDYASPSFFVKISKLETTDFNY